MTQVVSRVNGLKIAIPADARNIVHRFAIAGGGNELVFEPITRKTFDQSKGSEKNPMGLGSGSDTEAEDYGVATTVTLSENILEDEDEAPKPKTTRKPRKAAPAASADAPAAEEDIL